MNTTSTSINKPVPLKILSMLTMSAKGLKNKRRAKGNIEPVDHIKNTEDSAMIVGSYLFLKKDCSSCIKGNNHKFSNKDHNYIQNKINF